VSKVTGYCMRCKEKNVEIHNAQQVEMKNGKPAVTGIHEKCGTKMYKIGKLN